LFCCPPLRLSACPPDCPSSPPSYAPPPQSRFVLPSSADIHAWATPACSTPRDRAGVTHTSQGRCENDQSELKHREVVSPPRSRGTHCLRRQQWRRPWRRTGSLGDLSCTIAAERGQAVRHGGSGSRQSNADRGPTRQCAGGGRSGQLEHDCWRWEHDPQHLHDGSRRDLD
jgi:hypothetical protein